MLRSGAARARERNVPNSCLVESRSPSARRRAAEIALPPPVARIVSRCGADVYTRELWYCPGATPAWEEHRWGTVGAPRGPASLATPSMIQAASNGRARSATLGPERPRQNTALRTDLIPARSLVPINVTHVRPPRWRRLVRTSSDRPRASAATVLACDAPLLHLNTWLPMRWLSRSGSDTRGSRGPCCWRSSRTPCENPRMASLRTASQRRLREAQRCV